MFVGKIFVALLNKTHTWCEVSDDRLREIKKFFCDECWLDVIELLRKWNESTENIKFLVLLNNSLIGVEVQRIFILLRDSDLKLQVYLRLIEYLKLLLRIHSDR